MKIVYCIASTSNSRGMERVLAIKANYLASLGHKVHIITTDQRGQQPFFPLDKTIQCHDLGINYELNNGKSVFNKLWYYPAKQMKHKKKLTGLLREIKADIVVSMFCNDVSFIWDIADGSKKILEIHFSKFKRIQYGRKGLWRLADGIRSRNDERIVRKFDQFVVLTQEDKSYWGDLENIAVIPNPRSFSPTDVAPLENKKVIAVGGYTHQKGYDFLIEIWKRVCIKNSDWRLEIIGDGDLREEYARMIHQYDIGSRISLTGSVKEIGEKYKDASVLALSSRYEGLPMTLLEGQAYGLPVVAFACKCGPRDIIKNGKDGFLVAEGDLEGFAHALLTLMNDISLRQKMGAAAKINSERYSTEKIMSQWITLFETQLSK